MHIEKVAVIGTGMMGPGIAAVVALAGFDVTLIGERPDWAEDGVKKAHTLMDQLLDNELHHGARRRAGQTLSTRYDRFRDGSAKRAARHRSNP